MSTTPNKPSMNGPRRTKERGDVASLLLDDKGMREALRRAAEVAERRKALRQEPVKQPVR